MINFISRSFEVCMDNAIWYNDVILAEKLDIIISNLGSFTLEQRVDVNTSSFACNGMSCFLLSAAVLGAFHIQQQHLEEIRRQPIL